MSTPSSSGKPPPPPEGAVPWAFSLFGVDELSQFDGPLDVLPSVDDPRFQENVGCDDWFSPPPVVQENMNDFLAGPPAYNVPESPAGPRMHQLPADGGYDIDAVRELLPELASTESPRPESPAPVAATAAGHESSEEEYTLRSPRMGMDETVMADIFEDRKLGQWGTDERMAAELDFMLRNSPKDPHRREAIAPTNSMFSFIDEHAGPGGTSANGDSGHGIGDGEDRARATPPRFGANTNRPKHFTFDNARRKSMKTRSRMATLPRLSSALDQANLRTDINPLMESTSGIPCGFSLSLAHCNSTPAPMTTSAPAQAVGSGHVRTDTAPARGNVLVAAGSEPTTTSETTKNGRRCEASRSNVKAAISKTGSSSLADAVHGGGKPGAVANDGEAGGGGASKEKKKPPPQKKKQSSLEKKSAGPPRVATAIAGGHVATGGGPKKVRNNTAAEARARTNGRNANIVPEYDIYGFEDRSLQAECGRQALLDLAKVDMERIRTQRKFAESEEMFIASRYALAQAHDRWARATMSLEITSRAASVPFIQERQALAVYEKAQREKRAADAGVLEAQASFTSTDEKLKLAKKSFDVKMAAKAKAEARVCALDVHTMGVGLGGVLSGESSGDLKRRRGRDDDDDDDVSNNEQPSARSYPASVFNYGVPSVMRSEDDGQHRRPLRSSLTKADADQAIARGFEAERALRLRVEANAAELARQAESQRSALDFALNVAESDVAEGQRVAKDAEVAARRATVELNAARQAFGVEEATREEATAGKIHREAVKTAAPFVMWVNREVHAQKQLFDWGVELQARSQAAWETREAAREAYTLAHRKVQRALEVLSGFPGYEKVVTGDCQHNLFKFMVEDAYQKEKKSQAFTAGPGGVYSSSSSSGGGGSSSSSTTTTTTTINNSHSASNANSDARVT